LIIIGDTFVRAQPGRQSKILRLHPQIRPSQANRYRSGFGTPNAAWFCSQAYYFACSARRRRSRVTASSFSLALTLGSEATLRGGGPPGLGVFWMSSTAA
jgi:hypothetical protein